MKTGPKPKFEFKVLNGGKEITHTPENEALVVEKTKRIPPPKWLSKDAKIAWRRLTKLLAKYNLLSEMDYYTLILFCDPYARWKKMGRQITKHGASVESENSRGDITVKVRPEAKLYNAHWDQCRKILSEIGMTPLSRVRKDINNNLTDPLDDMGFDS